MPRGGGTYIIETGGGRSGDRDRPCYAPRERVFVTRNGSAEGGYTCAE
jgi:hypothetical protein